MKKAILSLLVSVLLMAQSVSAQTNISVEAPANNYYTPTILPNGNSITNTIKSCFLINQSELSALLTTSITSIGFNLVSGTGLIPINGNFTVYLQNTTDLTYSKGTSFTTAVSAMTTVFNGVFTVPATTNTTSVTFNFPSNFNYTGGGLYVAYNYSLTSQPPNSQVYTSYFANYSSYIMGATDVGSTSINYPLNPSYFRPVCVFEAINDATNEASLFNLVAPGKVAESMNTPHIITVDVQNRSINNLSNLNVDLTISGANPFTDTQTISTLAPGAITTVSFAPFQPSALGTNNLLISLPSDQNPANNQLYWSQDVSCDVASNSPPSTTYSTGFGSTSYANLCLSRFNFNGNSTLTAVNLAVNADYTSNVQLYGVVLDNTGAVIATTNTMNLSPSIFYTFQTFTFTNEQPLLANQDYYIGMAETDGYVMGYMQADVPPNVFFYADLDGSNLTASNDWGYFGIEPVINGFNIGISQPSQQLCKGQSMMLIADGPAFTYTWTSADVIQNPNNAAITVSPSASQSYILYAEDAAGCGNSASTQLLVISCVGIEKNSSKPNINLYPNPSVNNTTTLTGIEPGTFVIVYNMLGESVFTAQSDNEEMSIDLEGQPKGAYIIKITGKNNNIRMIKLLNQD